MKQPAPITMHRNLASLLLAVVLPLGAPAQNTDENAKPVPQSKALKLGVEKLVEITGESEAGIDQAATLYATAKRIETEHTLAQKDVQQVLALDEWRDAISACRQSAIGLASIVNGGGTMYSHGANRDTASVEDFLAKLAPSLPFPEGKSSAAAAKKIDDAIAFLHKLKPADPDDKEARANLADEAKRVTEHWEGLKARISELSPKLATQIADFAVDSLGWLKE